MAHPEESNSMADMHHPFLVGPRLYLRRIERADLGSEYFQWLNDEEVTRHSYQGNFPNSEASFAAYYEGSQGTDRINFAIVERDSGRHVGNVGLNGIDLVNGTAEIGILIGEKSCWGRGYAQESIRLVEGYAFDRLNLRRLWAGAWSGNTGMIRAFGKLGWSREGVQREHAFRDNAPHDVVLMGLLRREYYALEER